MPLSQVKDRHVEISIAFDGDDPVLSVVPPVARSLAAAFNRLADLEEGSRHG
jgi:hypothetical protein